MRLHDGVGDEVRRDGPATKVAAVEALNCLAGGFN